MAKRVTIQQIELQSLEGLARFHRLVDGLSDAQLLWRPAPGAWGNYGVPGAPECFAQALPPADASNIRTGTPKLSSGARCVSHGHSGHEVYLDSGATLPDEGEGARNTIAGSRS